MQLCLFKNSYFVSPLYCSKKVILIEAILAYIENSRLIWDTQALSQKLKPNQTKLKQNNKPRKE